MARQIVVEIVGDASKFSKATSDAIGKTETLGGKLKTVGKGIAVGAGIASFNLLTSAIGGVVGKLGEARDAFQEDQASQAQLRSALEANAKGWDGTTDAIEKVIEAQMRLGFSDDEQRDSLANLISVTGDVTEAQELQAQAMDLARLKGLDLRTAGDLLGKVYAGNLGTLSRYGIVLEDGATATEALAEIQRRAAGQAEAYADTSLGKQTAAQLKVGEAMEKVGSAIDKISMVVIPIAADAITFLVDALGTIGEAISPIVGAVSGALIPVFKTLGPIVGKILGGIGVAVKVMGATFAPIFAAIGTGARFMSDVLGTQFKMIGSAIGVLQTVFKGLGDLVGGVFRNIGQIIKGAINGVIGVINGVIRAINSIKIPAIEVGPVKIDGWNGLNLGYIPKLHKGGVVPGATGTEVLSLLQAGETVTPRGGGGGQTININIESFIGSDRDIDKFAERLAMRLRLTGA